MKETIIIAALLLAGCQANQEILRSNPANQTPAAPRATLEPRRTSFDQDVQDIRDAGLDVVYIVRRKDGAVLDADDKRFVRQNTPIQTNRFVISEEGKTLIIGSGFSLPAENVEALKKRFRFEDLSKPIEVEVRADENTNKPANQNR